MERIINWWNGLPYSQRGALIRAFRTFLAVVVSILLSLLTAGLLFPATWSPVTIAVLTTILTPILQGFDKFLREREVEKQQVKSEELAKETLDSGALTDNPSGD